LILEDEAYAAQNTFAQKLAQSQATAVPGHVESIVIAGLDPAIHPFRKKMDARVKSALSHRGGESPP
jgi:hypothetical protein